MRNAKLYRYQLAMDSGVILREQKLNYREGFIVELNQDGIQGRGEVAPLIGFSQESLADVEPILIQALSAWLETGSFDVFDTYPPSVSFGLSMAQMLLDKELPNTDKVQVAPLCSGDPDELLAVFETMQGEKVAKFKVGLYEPIRDGMLVNLFLESIPDLKVRLDANRAWSLDKALKFASYINPTFIQRIAFIEEPCQTPTQSLSFAEQIGVKIAWDETLQAAVHNNQLTEFIQDPSTGAHPKVSAWVIKPTLIGSVGRCQMITKQAHRQGKAVVISSAIESSLGLNHLRRLNHFLQTDQVPGLDTLQLFQTQLEDAWPGSKLERLPLSTQTLVWEESVS